jgi:hypothetical protein
MRTLLLGLAVALVVAPSAAAKGPVQLCGAGGCVTLGAETAAAPVLSVPTDAARIAPSPVAPYYVIRFADVGGPLSYWIPSAHALRSGGTGAPVWTPVPAPAADLLTRAAATLAPKPAPTNLSFVRVGRRAVAHPRGYLRLYALGAPVADPGAAAGGWERIDLYSFAHWATPWTDGSNVVAISRRGAFLRRDGEVVRIPAALAARIRAREPLR